MPKNRYEVIGTLGCGATSRVDKARDTVLGRTVALKTLVHAFGAPTEQKQFLREAQIVSQLSHPSIVNLYDVGIEEGSVAYLVMEYVPGKTLQQALSESPIPFPRACAWAADLAGALHRAHRAGIIHGDVKPANILVTEDGNVKLGDFGIARLSTQVSGSGRLMGTPAYLSPEQIHGEAQNTR
jgi:eukaryotic-like serine/threonine-protein kinase